MELSNDLISQFVKITKDDSQKQTETIVYGTIKISDGKQYVQIDGSTLYTPITTTTTAKDGDRVTVMIKDHSAIVTGNMSAPSARQETVDEVEADLSNKISEFGIVIADKVSTEQLNAVKADITTLTAKDVEITNKLTAAEADIDTLEADNVNINSTLTAHAGKFDTIDSTFVNINGELTAANAKIETLEVIGADFRTLESDYGTFKTLTSNDLTAVKANIDTLQAEDVTINGRLDANEANITTLQSDNATITGRLDANDASIGTLQADAADIDTLIFGSASGSTIQTSFANAVIAQLGNAQIKSAMIENIAADKITSGDIITNNINVKSQNGKLLISDETIQISDDSRVRVQIGKDSSNDYSINIWDVNGNLMFSKGGITDSAIKEAIIRNDMISADANISASKLDIGSLFTEINGSTETIKSSKIYFDDKDQTLDVAFTEMSTDVTELGESVSSQGTMISTIQGQISSKIWQQDINTAVEGLASDDELNALSTQYSSLEQTVNSVSATVASNTTEIAKKADSSSVTTVNNKVTELETTLNGFQSTVSETYATKTELSATDAKATNAQTAANEVSSKMSEVETKISQNEEAIALAATKTEVSETFGNYYTKTETDSAISVSANSITQTVSATYSTKEETSNVEDTANEANTIANANQNRITISESTIKQLENSISTLVVNENGESMMVQDPDSFEWSFNIGSINNSINNANERLDDLSGKVDDVDVNIDRINSLTNDLTEKTAYIIMTTDETGSPCMELGKEGNQFKLRITNTSVDFMDGTSRIAYVSNKTLYIESAIVKDNLQIGEGTGFVWKKRASGNMGLRWVGGDS